MRKTPRLSRPSINRYPHIDHILDLSEQVIQIAVTHIEGHVPYEEGFGRSVEWSIRRV